MMNTTPAQASHSAADQPEPVLVVGGGTMGAGIVQTFLECGFPVMLREVDLPACQAAYARIAAALRRTASRTGVSDDGISDMLGRLTVSWDPALAAGPIEPHLVIESVPEQVGLKQSVLADLSSRYPYAVIATNTSALSINLLADSVSNPERFLGMHFFNPVPRSSLVEVVRGAATRKDVLAAVHATVERAGKVSIEVRDSPCFATSRLGIAIGLEAMRMVEEEVASAEDIDLGMVQGYKFPIGPLALSDLVGLDVRLAIADHLSAELGDRFRAPGILREKVANGELGAKTRQGFYSWDADGRKIVASPRSSNDQRPRLDASAPRS